MISLPAICIVAVLAGTPKLDFLESPVVLIGVTALAAAMGQIFELSILLTGPRSVALLAGLRLMQSREREVRGAMIESGSRLKGIRRVATQAIGAELPLMLILMTGRALTAKTKERPVQILQFDLGAGAG
jgi:membrane protein implicated in regulation of membrane protease activity